MMAVVYCCDGCRMVDPETSTPAPCLLVMHNGEPPKRCVCGKGATTEWRILTQLDTSDTKGVFRLGPSQIPSPSISTSIASPMPNPPSRTAGGSS